MCRCGFSGEPDGICNGTHKLVNKIKAKIVADLEERGFIEAAESVKKS